MLPAPSPGPQPPVPAPTAMWPPQAMTTVWLPVPPMVNVTSIVVLHFPVPDGRFCVA